jgi:DNA repair exonuclease SbcCD ATPase subunit
MIVFEKIRYKNFLSTGNSFLEFILNQHETTLIVGLNGSGKSTLLDALSFVLFGKAYRKINKPQLVNSIIEKNCLVEVEFTVGETRYMVRRGINPNIFEVYQDGRLLNQTANSRDYQEILEDQIIKASHKSFCQIVVLGTAAFEPFMQLGLPQRREVIEDLLDLQVFSVMNFDLKERASTNNQKLDVTAMEKETLTKQLALLKYHADVLEANREKTYQEKKNKLAVLEEERDEIIVEIRGYEVEIGRYANLIDEEKEQKERLKNLYKFESSASHNRDEAFKKSLFFADNETCPTCTQIIDSKIRFNKGLDFQHEGEKYDHNASIIHEELCKTETRLEDIKKVLQQVQDWKLELQVFKSRKSSIQRQMDELKKDIDNLSQITEVAADVPKVEKALEESRTECIDLEERKRIYAYAALLLKDTGIKSKIIKQYVPIINKHINKNLGEFELHINFNLDENFNEKIKSSARGDFTYESFSQGERQRIDLAILFAWRAISALRNTINTNILILDEVFDSSLDSNAVECLMHTIRVHAQSSNIIVISHKDQMFDKFEQVIRFEKKRNFSIIGEA